MPFQLSVERFAIDPTENGPDMSRCETLSNEVMPDVADPFVGIVQELPMLDFELLSTDRESCNATL